LRKATISNFTFNCIILIQVHRMTNLSMTPFNQLRTCFKLCLVWLPFLWGWFSFTELYSVRHWNSGKLKSLTNQNTSLGTD
jgi:hypothetical protein